MKIIRGDLIHPVVSGNKLYKLLPILERAEKLGKGTIVSVGGRYSNHLHALAWAGNAHGFETVGLVRGYSEQPLTPTLKDCQRWGMTLNFISHDNYQGRHSDPFWKPWLDKYPDAFRVDEGGWSPEAVEGSQYWWHSIPADIQLVICAIGSGSTMAGLLSSKRYRESQVKLSGVPVFKDADNYASLQHKLVNMGLNLERFELWTPEESRGFGKLTQNQKAFKQQFENENNIELDPVYTTKVFYEMSLALIKNNRLQGMNIAVLHTGGLQGNRS